MDRVAWSRSRHSVDHGIPDGVEQLKVLFLTVLVRLSAMDASGQGTIFFSNFQQGGPNAPVYQSDGTTKLSGLQFMAELLAGPSTNSLAPTASTGFLTGNAAGYFDGGIQTLSGVNITATVWVQVDVWNTGSGASFAQSQSSGLVNSWWQSPKFTVVTGGGAINPFPAAVLTGLGTSPVFLNGLVPEPSTFALGVVGAVVALFRFRPRKQRKQVPTFE
jgi:PEP-CTERM motif-containing protein